MLLLWWCSLTFIQHLQLLCLGEPSASMKANQFT